MTHENAHQEMQEKRLTTWRHVAPTRDTMTPEQAELAYQITEQMPNVHGAPIHIGDPSIIGIEDIDQPDYGQAVTIRDGEVAVFWPCGVTPQAAIEQAKPPIVITHAPGHMFITDIPNSELNDYLEAKKK